MKLPHITRINILWPVWITLGLVLCFGNKVDWWVLILIFTSQFELIWEK